MTYKVVLVGLFFACRPLTHFPKLKPLFTRREGGDEFRLANRQDELLEQEGSLVQFRQLSKVAITQEAPNSSNRDY